MQLEHLAIFRNVLMLRNPAARAGLGAALQVVGPRRAGAAESESLLVVRRGDRVEFSLTNQSPSTVFLAIFRLGADYSIVRIKPEAERNLALAPGRAAGVRVVDTIGVDTIGDAHGTEAFDWVRYKIFVMTERIDLEVLQLPPFGARTTATRAVVRADAPLGDLLDYAVLGPEVAPKIPPAHAITEARQITSKDCG